MSIFKKIGKIFQKEHKQILTNNTYDELLFDFQSRLSNARAQHQGNAQNQNTNNQQTQNNHQESYEPQFDPKLLTYLGRLNFESIDDLTLDEVNKRYRKLSKVYHPDAPDGDAELFKNLTEAKNKLTEYLEENGGEQ